MAALATAAIGKATLALGAKASTATAIRGAVVGAGKLLPLIGTGLDIAGTLQAGRAVDEQSKLEQARAEQQALQEEIRGTEEERLRRKAGEKLEARQRAQFAKGGVKVGEGTPLLIMAETVLDATEDIEAIREGAKARASSFRFTGQTFRSIGKAQKTASKLKAGSSLLSGISNITRSNP